MTIKITTDSTCDLPASLLSQYDIHVLPLYVLRGGKAYRDGLEITPQEIFDHVAGGGDLCTTSAVNLADYMTVFGGYARRYDAVIHVGLSSEFSSCVQNATLAAADYSNVYVVDSRQLTCGTGALAIQAACLAKEGVSPEEIVETLKNSTDKVNTSFLLSQLEYLQKGGRCSSVAALGANLLKLKPSIEVAGGKMQVSKKYRGEFEKAIGNFIRDRLSGQTVDLSRVYLGGAGVEDETMEVAKAAVLAAAPFEEVVVYEAGCTISCHCGPATLGLVFVTK